MCRRNMCCTGSGESDGGGSRSAVADRGEFVMAVSAGRTQCIMQRTLAEEELHGSAFVSSRYTSACTTPRYGQKSYPSSRKSARSLADSPAAASMLCQSNRQTWTQRLGNMSCCLLGSLVHLPRSTWSMWASHQTVILLRWCQGIQSVM